MQKKTRLPLLMSNGIEVQTLEELKNNFLIEDVWKHWGSGVLETWLKERYYGDIVEEIEVISVLGRSDADEKLYAIFGVENPDTIEEEEEKMQLRQEKLAKLKTCVDEEGFDEYKRFIDKMAFTQDDLYDLLDAGQNDIYLCGDKFEIPLSMRDINYRGVNQPIVSIRVNTKINLAEEKGITFSRVRFAESDLKNRAKKFLIGHKTSISEIPNFLSSGCENEAGSIVCEYGRIEPEEADEILDEIMECASEDDIISAIYEIMSKKDDEYKEILEKYGDIIKKLYKECFS